MDDKKMEPCRFCGGTNLEINTGPVIPFVECQQCEATMYAEDGKTVEDAWNRRVAIKSRADEAFALVSPLIKAVAKWEKDHGTLACIVPQEFEAVCKMLESAAIHSSARGAMSIMESDERTS